MSTLSISKYILQYCQVHKKGFFSTGPVKLVQNVSREDKSYDVFGVINCLANYIDGLIYWNDIHRRRLGVHRSHKVCPPSTLKDAKKFGRKVETKVWR